MILLYVSYTQYEVHTYMYFVRLLCFIHIHPTDYYSTAVVRWVAGAYVWYHILEENMYHTPEYHSRRNAPLRGESRGYVYVHVLNSLTIIHTERVPYIHKNIKRVKQSVR